MHKRIILLLAFIFFSHVSWAQSLARSIAATDPGYDNSWYMGVAIGAMTYNQSDLNAFKMQDRRLIIGKQVNRGLAFEMHVGNSSSDTTIVTGVPVTLSVDNYIAGFVKGTLTFTSKDWKYNRFRLYGMLGGTRLKATSDDTVVTSSGVKTSASAGVGMEFLVDNINIQLGFTRYINRSSGGVNYSLDSLHLGMVYLFGQNKVVNAR